MNDYMDNPEFDDVLARCMEDVQRQYRTVDECLQAYPHYASQLKPLLLTGLMTSRLKPPQLSAAAIAALENRMRAETRHHRRLKMASPGANTVYGLRRLAAVLVIAVFLAFGGAGLVAASADTVPGDTLYTIKRLWEAIILALSPLSGSQEVLWQQIAETRLGEIERLAAENRLSETALLDFHRALYHLTGAATKQSEPKVMALMQDAASLLVTIRPLPDAQAVYDDVLRLTQDNVRSGILTQPPDERPASIIRLTALPTLMPTATASASLTATVTASSSPTPSVTASPTASATLTATLTVSATPSRTPRIPATATKTLTPLPTLTSTVTPSITPTATWTALPLPTFVPPVAFTVTPSPPVPDATESPGTDAGGDATRIRETEQAVFKTQTAGPPSATAVGSP